MDVLTQIIMLLFSLANSAEAASVRSGRVRRRMLAALQPVEAAGLASVVRWARHFGAPLSPQALLALSAPMFDADVGDSPDDMLRFAERFRALALVLAYIAAWAQQFARRLTAVAHTRQVGSECSSALPTAQRDAPALPPPDTS